MNPFYYNIITLALLVIDLLIFITIIVAWRMTVKYDGTAMINRRAAASRTTANFIVAFGVSAIVTILWVVLFIENNLDYVMSYVEKIFS